MIIDLPANLKPSILFDFDIEHLNPYKKQAMRVRVLLINPFYPISETPSPPLGLAYLGAALEQAGVQVKILDYVVYPYRRDALESVLKEFKPHLAGATAVSMTFDHARAGSQRCKGHRP